MRHRCPPTSSAALVRHALGLAVAAVPCLLTGCIDFGPFDFDPRLQRLGMQMEEVANVVAAERAAEVLDPGAPLVGGTTLGNRRVALGVRVVAASGHRSDLSTADAVPQATTRPSLGTTAANSQTVAIDGALKVLPGFQLSSGYRVLGLDAVGRLARVAGAAPGDETNSLATGYGGRLGLLSDSTGRSGLSLSLMRANLPGARYDVAISPTVPVTEAQAAVEVSQIQATALRLQGSVALGAWGIEAGVGTNTGNYQLDRSARLVAPDSTTTARQVTTGHWRHSLWNVGLTRQINRAELALRYGFAEGSTETSMLGMTSAGAGPRHSLSLGMQLRY